MSIWAISGGERVGQVQGLHAAETLKYSGVT